MRVTGSRTLDVLAHPLFDGAPPHLLIPILQRVSAREVSVGQILARPEVERCLLVFEGALLSYVLLPDGRRIIFEVIRPGGIDGILNVTVAGEGHFSEAAVKSVVVALDRPVLDALMEAEPLIARTVISLSMHHLQRREAQLEAVIHHEATRRVAAMLLSLIRYTGRPASARSGSLFEVSPRPTHQVLADMIGLRRETVTVQIGRLRRLGAIRVRGCALILDERLLANAVEGEIPRAIQSIPGAPEHPIVPRRGEGLTIPSHGCPANSRSPRWRPEWPG